MNRISPLAILLLLAAPVGCGGGEPAPTHVLPAAEPASVVVTVDAAQLPVRSRTTARATAVDRYGARMAAATVRWRMAAGGEVAAVDSLGSVTGLSVGSAVVAADVSSVTGTARIDVVSASEEQRGVQQPVLPQVILDFPYPPVTGRSIKVGGGGDLQGALNSARRGDEIVLETGATFTGNFTLPSKPGDAANGWITVRSAGSNQLPPIGTRVATTDGRLMARLVTANTGPAIKTAPGASGWRLVGLEVTVSESVTRQQYGLIFLGEGGALQTSANVPSDVVLDRMYIHGQATTNMSRCVALNSARTQVSDSYLAECHGKDFDSQAIAGWNGPGPYRIVNNTLEGAGENLMFGGADPSIPGLVPSDIEIRQNFIHTPIQWKGVWQKKNLFELKNAARVLVDGNVLDGSWTDGQSGFAVVIKSANQSGRCRWCRTTDVTFRRNLIVNAGAGFNIAGVGDNPNVDTTARRVLVSETVLDHIGVGEYAGDRRGFQVLNRASDITIERTVLDGSVATALSLDRRGPVQRTAFRDNVWVFGQYGAISSGAGPGSASLAVGAPGAIWERMVFVGPQQAGFPAGTSFVAREAQASTAVSVRAAVDAATRDVARR